MHVFLKIQFSGFAVHGVCESDGFFRVVCATHIQKPFFSRDFEKTLMAYDDAGDDQGGPGYRHCLK